MSFFVEDTDMYLILSLLPSQSHQTHTQTQSQGKTLVAAQLSELLPKYITHPCNTVLSGSFSSSTANFRYIVPNFYRNLQAIASVYLNIHMRTLTIHLKLLNQDKGFLRVLSNDREKIVFKYLSKKQNHREFNIKIAPHTGTITIFAPLFYFSNDLLPIKLGRYVEGQLRDLQNSLKSNFKLVDSIFQLCEDSGSAIKSSVSNHNFQSLLKHFDFIKLMNLQLCFAQQAKEKEESLNNRWEKEKESINKILQGLVLFETQSRPMQLYTYSLVSEFENKELFNNIQNIIAQERINMRTRIQLPVLPKIKVASSVQNYYVLNQILINDKFSYNKCKKINSGGFTQIYLTELIYWYIGSYGVDTTSEVDIITSKPPLQKKVIIKHQNKKSLKIGQRSRLDHEKYILKQIKYGLSIFLCKYYFAGKNPHLKDDLLSDYIEFPNFSDYCTQNMHTMSLHTKIYFSIMIAQSLRYLQNYSIVHLDLKPTNIMLSHKLTIKLIDFGESYHPSLGKHLPGFSMPYSAPQNYCRFGEFKYKHDIFSLGVIMFELFFDRLPFFFYSQTLKSKAYSEGNFFDYLFFCAQQQILCGQMFVLPLVQAIIMKCLRADTDDRPELQWIVFILKECLSFFY